MSWASEENEKAESNHSCGQLEGRHLES
jgi:hypothetical protein